jgi:pimeloyl-ACP methyl ester carboxylesterase
MRGRAGTLAASRDVVDRFENAGTHLAGESALHARGDRTLRRGVVAGGRSSRDDQLLPRLGTAVAEGSRCEASPDLGADAGHLGDRDSYLGSDLAEPHPDDVPNLDRVERLADASHWVHHDEAERLNQLLIDFFGAAA